MIGEILNAVILECRELLKDTGGTVILKTDYRGTSDTSYTMPLLLLDLLEAPDSAQLPGGVTRKDWIFALNAYNYEPNSYTDDTSGYSEKLLNIIDTIRQHFSLGTWLTQGMTDINTNYGFKFTLSGVVPADALDQDGLIMGYRIMFDSIAFDTDTSFVQMSESDLEHVTQQGYPPTT
jgi:hypothetical protein